MLEFEEVKIITSEEEVVGEIVDEMDITEELIQRIKKSQILVHGWTEVRRVNDFLKVELGDEVLTIGGLIQENLDRIPKIGEEIRIENCRQVVHEADPRTIQGVYIFKDEKVAVPVETASLNPLN